jgi:hypothetical protein
VLRSTRDIGRDDLGPVGISAELRIDAARDACGVSRDTPVVSVSFVAVARAIAVFLAVSILSNTAL